MGSYIKIAKVFTRHYNGDYRRYMAEILPIRRKTLSNQSVNLLTISITI